MNIIIIIIIIILGETIFTIFSVKTIQ